MRPKGWLFILASTVAGFANQAQPEAAKTIQGFTDRVQAYVKMEEKLEQSLPALQSRADSKQIADHQQAMAAKILASRRDARQGDVFTPEAAAQFLAIIRNAFKQPEAPAVRRTLAEGDPAKATVLHVNDRYPEEIPLTTMPPTLLRMLPELPKGLAYRIIGRALALQDVKTNLIVDFIPNAIP